MLGRVKTAEMWDLAHFLWCLLGSAWVCVSGSLISHSSVVISSHWCISGTFSLGSRILISISCLEFPAAVLPQVPGLAFPSTHVAEEERRGGPSELRCAKLSCDSS